MIYAFLTTIVVKQLLPQTRTFAIAVSRKSCVSLESKLTVLVFIIFKRKSLLTNPGLFFGLFQRLPSVQERNCLEI